MKKQFRIVGSMVAGLVLALSFQAAQAAGSAEKGKAKAGVCAGCHGGNGQSANPMWPNLAGQGAEYIAKQLADFKSGARKDPLMAGQAAALSREDMADLGAYFASLAPKKGAASNKALALKGQRLYRGGNAKTGVAACMGCHGPSGKGIPVRFPAVSGQHATYSEKQLKAFKDGERTNDNKVMTGIAFRMSLDEIRAAAEYMQGLN